MHARRHPLLVAALTLPLLVGLGACGDEDSDDDATSEESEAAASETTESTDTTDAPSGDADADATAAGDAVAAVFDSSVPFDEKVALVEAGESHRADHEAYVGAAGAVGGIALEPTDVAVDGDTATVTYRVLFGGTEAYSDLSLDVNRVDGEWVVPTDAFCGFLASARTPCAAAG